MAEFMRETFVDLGLQVQWQQVEEGRANVLGTRAGTGGAPSLMFNGHMDTSYSGREPWLAHVPGFQPSAFVEDGRLYGLGISNMKGALACYVEALRALSDAGVRLRGDVLVAAERDVTRWFSDASVLTRYGIATVNYGTSTGLLDTVKGENLEIEGLVKTAEVYARAAMNVCVVE